MLLFRAVRGVLNSWDASVIKRFCSSNILLIGKRVFPARKYPSAPEIIRITKSIVDKVAAMRSFVSETKSESKFGGRITWFSPKPLSILNL